MDIVNRIISITIVVFTEVKQRSNNNKSLEILLHVKTVLGKMPPRKIAPWKIALPPPPPPKKSIL